MQVGLLKFAKILCKIRKLVDFIYTFVLEINHVNLIFKNLFK